MSNEKVNVYLDGHDFEHEIRGILKAFYPKGEIIFLSKKALVDNQGLLIENTLLDNGFISLTKISKDGNLLAESSSNIENIDIKVEDKKRILKLGIKQSIFKSLSELSDIKLPWGVLTGIRPTKIVHELLDKDLDVEIIKKILIEEYLLDLEKIELMLEVTRKERDYIYPLDSDKYSLYISIPFCPSRCLYCSFPSNDIAHCGTLEDDYVEKLIFELVEMSKIMNDKTIDTVYIGGGTPTAISARNLDKIIKAVYNYLGHEMREFTVEAGRPDTIDLEMLTMLKNNNIKRISINPQTMNHKTLKTIGRNHSVEDIINSFKMAKDLGFESINMDIILGLPGEDELDIRDTMEQIKALDPENLTVHTMSLKTKSDLKKDIGSYQLTSQIDLENMIVITKEYANNMGLAPYYMYRQKQILGNFENVGYAKNGYECIYNMLIMEEKQTIIAIGAGATSKIYSQETGKIRRIANLKNLREYINRVEEMVEKKRSEIYVNKSAKRN